MVADRAPALIRRAVSGDSLDHLIDAAYRRAEHARGGAALLEQLWDDDTELATVRSAMAAEVIAGHVWIALLGPDIVAGALIRSLCVQAIWVEPTHRRRKIATALLNAVLDESDPPHDAWALPGDRATKSLYESVGWKARLLTMRGA
jgi:GNAT superfamily N-acetyltransferase